MVLILMYYYIIYYFVLQEHQQMDPTDIVKVPYDLERLCLYVISVVVVLGILATAATQNCRKLSIPGLALLTLTGHGVMVLCGASPVQNAWHTLVASLYTTALISFDPLLCRRF
jgi:hypothetical protein